MGLGHALEEAVEGAEVAGVGEEDGEGGEGG